MNQIQPNPFVPKSGMEPRMFVGREEQIELFDSVLESARHNKRFDHCLIMGEWGIGKTALLKEFKKIAQSRKLLTSLVTIREFQETDTFLSATQHLITQLPRNIPIKPDILQNFMSYLAGFGFTVPVVGGGIQFPDKKELMGDPQVMLLDALQRLWKEVQTETEVLVVLLDDVQNYQPISGYLTILKNVLSDESIVKETGFLFVLSSTTKDWSEFLTKHHPIGRYFTPIMKLSHLSHDQMMKFLDETLASTGVRFDDEVREKVYEYSGGHPYELQVLCSFLYDNQIVGEVTGDVWDVSLEMALTRMGDVLLDSLYESASLTERAILREFAEESGDFRSRGIDMETKILSSEEVAKYLNRLAEKELLIRKGRGIYSFPDRLFREYVSKYL
jgi:hypothetical protein